MYKYKMFIEKWSNTDPPPVQLLQHIRHHHVHLGADGGGKVESHRVVEQLPKMKKHDVQSSCGLFLQRSHRLLDTTREVEQLAGQGQ